MIIGVNKLIFKIRLIILPTLIFNIIFYVDINLYINYLDNC